jgi:hypothetical protein
MSAAGEVVIVHLMSEDLLDQCGTAEEGARISTPVVEDVTCPDCQKWVHA